MAWSRRLLRETIVAHLRSGDSLRGVLVAEHRDCLILAHAAFLDATSTTPVDGEAVIPRDQVSWVQRLNGGEQ
jgi:hypothetical protein